MKHCIDCGTELSENAKFCPSCGKKVESQGCPQCGCTNIQAGIKFCPECGAKILSSEANIYAVPQAQKPVQTEEQVHHVVSTSLNNNEREQKKEDKITVSHKTVEAVIEDEQKIVWKKDGISQKDSFGSPDIQNSLEPFKAFVNSSFYYKFTDTQFDKAKIRKFIATLEKEEVVHPGYMIAPNAWIYYDDTVMGGGDNGFLVAKDKSIYFCELGEKSIRIDFEAITCIAYNKDEKKIEITYLQDLSSTSSAQHIVEMLLNIEGDKQEFVRLLADFIFHRRYLPPPEPDLAANPKDWREAVVTPAVLLTAMILAARADGVLNAEETTRITEFGKQHMKPVVFGIQFKSAQTLPVDAGIIATAVNLSKQAEAARVYVYSCCFAKGGTAQERTYLDTLAQALHIPKATQNRLEQEAAGFTC